MSTERRHFNSRISMAHENETLEAKYEHLIRSYGVDKWDAKDFDGQFHLAFFLALLACVEKIFSGTSTTNLSSSCVLLCLFSSATFSNRLIL
ncbi:hypothetical protein HXY32_03735 [Candidatus Bathyarchaeota archaeon]|nr:hypothetical protein [Candidatus Bathyarchaeota archaeon]